MTVRGTVNELTAAEVCVLVFRAKPDVEVDGYVLPVSDIEINTADDSLTVIWYLEGYVTIISEDGDMAMFEKPITIPGNTEIGDVKLMIWDKAGTMKPLTEVTPVVYPYSYDLGE